MEHIIILMGRSMKDNGKMIYNMDMDMKDGQMGPHI